MHDVVEIIQKMANFNLIILPVATGTFQPYRRFAQSRVAPV